MRLKNLEKEKYFISRCSYENPNFKLTFFQKLFHHNKQHYQHLVNNNLEVINY